MAVHGESLMLFAIKKVPGCDVMVLLRTTLSSAGAKWFPRNNGEAVGNQVTVTEKDVPTVAAAGDGGPVQPPPPFLIQLLRSGLKY